MTGLKQAARVQEHAVRGVYADLLPAEAVKAWRIAIYSMEKAATPLEVTATKLADIVFETAPRCQHKDFLAILRGHEGKATKMLHLFVIKQKSQAIYRRNPDTGAPESFRPLYADLLFELAVKDFNPLEPFRWEPGCDVVGIDRTLIEGRAK